MIMINENALCTLPGIFSSRYFIKEKYGSYGSSPVL